MKTNTTKYYTEKLLLIIMFKVQLIHKFSLPFVEKIASRRTPVASRETIERRNWAEQWKKNGWSCRVGIWIRDLKSAQPLNVIYEASDLRADEIFLIIVPFISDNRRRNKILHADKPQFLNTIWRLSFSTCTTFRL